MVKLAVHVSIRRGIALPSKNILSTNVTIGFIPLFRKGVDVGGIQVAYEIGQVVWFQSAQDKAVPGIPTGYGVSFVNDCRAAVRENPTL